MRSTHLRFVGYTIFSLTVFCGSSILARAQAGVQAGKSAIDLDKELRAKEPLDRGRSYYHYSLSRWWRDKGDVTKALAELREAVKYDESSAPIRVELASLLAESGNYRDAMEEVQEAARLDPKSPEPHLLLANLYLRSQGRGATAREALRKAAKELETTRDLAPEDERAYYTLGEVYFELNEPEKAIQAFEKFQSLVPNVDGGYVKIAQYYEGKGNFEKAIEYLNKAIQTQPDTAESTLVLANLYSRLNRHKEAIPLYKNFLERVGDNPTVKKQLASVMVEAGEFEGAVTLLEEVQKTIPRDKDVPLMLGRALLGSRRIPQAIAILSSILNDNPTHIEAAFYIGNAYEQSGEPQKAAQVFTRLLEQTAGTAEEHKANRLVFQQHLAADYQELGENDKAIALYEQMVNAEATPNSRLVFLLVNAYRLNRQLDKALTVGKQQFEKNPTDTSLAVVYARALGDAGKTKEGTEILTKMLQTDASNADIYVNLSEIYVQGKRYSDAEKILRRAEDKKLDRERVRFQLATVYEKQKDFDRAESVVKEVLKDNPKNAAALNYIGYMLADRGVRLQEAVKYVEEALALDPDNGAYLDSLGWAFFKSNEFEKAEQYLLRAVVLVKNDPVIHDHLGDLYFKTGDLQKARDFWTKSVSVKSAEQDESQKVREKLEKLDETVRKQKHR